MRSSVMEAEGQLADLVRRAGAGEEVLLTREGEAVVRLVPIDEKPKPSAAEKKLVLDRIMASAPRSETNEAARSQDFLYDEDGLPG